MCVARENGTTGEKNEIPTFFFCLFFFLLLLSFLSVGNVWYKQLLMNCACESCSHQHQMPRVWPEILDHLKISCPHCTLKSKP